jgi:hypothetical protein
MIEPHPPAFDAGRAADALCGGHADHRTEDGRAKSRRVALVKDQAIRTT